MIENLSELKKLLQNDKITVANHNLKDVIQNYSFYVISDQNDYFQHIEEISHNIIESKIIIINQYETKNEKNEDKYFYIGFQRTVLIIKQNSKTLISNLFSNKSNLFICFLSNSKNIFDHYYDIKYNLSDYNQIFEAEITNFNRELSFIHTLANPVSKKIKQLWRIISSCISGYLIKQSYSKLHKNRFADFTRQNYPHKIQTFSEDEFIILRLIDSGSIFETMLIYNIQRSEIFALKKPKKETPEVSKLIKRETENYKNISHPLLPKFYGTISTKNYLIIEFINGKTLDNIKNLEKNEKITIIYEIMILIQYFHKKNFVLRDLKPNNIMIDLSKTVVLIDFDRMILNSNIENFTTDFISDFVDPDANIGKISFKNDIYSLGKIILYIFNKEEKEQIIKQIVDRCISNSEQRPTIFELVSEFYKEYHSKIEISNIEKNAEENFLIGLEFMTGEFVSIDKNKGFYYFSLSANQNYPFAQFYIGDAYFNGVIGPKNINKALYYFNLSAEQNNANAQHMLGMIYLNGESGNPDIEKAIYYFQLASNQNFPKSQFLLGYIYSKKIYGKYNINKSIYYYKLASNLNLPEAQYNLGCIYYKGKHVQMDIEKAIYYFQLASNHNVFNANRMLASIYYNIKHDVDKAIHYFSILSDQNDSLSQYYLGCIYYEGRLVFKNINKSIYYFTLSANLCNSESQYCLGLIYFQNKVVNRDIQKSIYYFTQAADQNNSKSQFYLGLIYSNEKYVPINIEKSIYYYKLASNQNNSESQINLAVIYFEGQYVPRDINKSIYYLSLASNNNNTIAQENLGIIYYNIKNIKKSIEYLSLAADKNFPTSQFFLGKIYLKGKYVKRNVAKGLNYLKLSANKNFIPAQCYLGDIYLFGLYDLQNIEYAIHYYSISAKQNDPNSQHNLGIIYLSDEYFNVNKGLYYLKLAAENNLHTSQFALGYLYHEGFNIKKDIQNAIKLYNEASSFNNQYAKNNLGIIYKNEFENYIDLAIIYFEEAINQSNDYLSMHNLAKIYFYNQQYHDKIHKSIELLIKSANQNFYHSKKLLCIVLIKLYDLDFDKIGNEINKYSNKSNNFVSEIIQLIYDQGFNDENIFKHYYEYYKNIDFLYTSFLNVISTYDMKNKDYYKTQICRKSGDVRDISSEFYDGFGIE